MKSWVWLFKREGRVADLNEEIQAHLRMATLDEMERGETFQEATHSAKSEFGNISLVKEITREMWGWASFERLAQDLRYAGRLLRKSPGFTVVAILSMALGIGANTAIFSLIDAALLRSLPVRSPNELVAIGDPTRVGSLSQGSGRTDIFSYPFYERFRERNHVFSDVLGSARSEHLDISLEGERSSAGSQGEAPQARLVTGNYFSVLGVSAVLGRTFTEEETRIAGNAPVIVISYGYWTRKFARDLGVIGRKLVVNGSIFTIIGVTPPDFFGDIVGRPNDLWFPITMQTQANPGHSYLKDAHVSWLMLMGRLNPGVSQAQAKAEVNVIAAHIFAELYGASSDDLKNLRRNKIEVSSGAKGFSRLRKEFSLPLITLMGIVVLVLLICCANVANLQLARAASRGREMGLRLAVGAGQTRLIRQLLTESVMLAALGGAVGLLFAQWGSHLLLRLISSSGPLPLDVRLNASVLVFTAGASVFAGLLFGLAPALQTMRLDLVSILKESKSGQSYGFAQQFGKALIVSQIVFSLMLIVGAGLFIRTLGNLESTDVGYARKGLMLVQIDFQTAGYKDKQVNQLTRQLLERLQRIPGVQGATVSENGLFSGTDSQTDADVEGYTPHSDADKQIDYDRVGPNYFQVAGTPVILGRGIHAQDTATAQKVAVINEKMARFYFSRTNPIGRHIFVLDDDGKKRTALAIVGVVRDVKERELREPTPRRLYQAFLQHTDEISVINFEIRTQIEPSAISESVRREFKSFDPHLPITSLKTASALIDETLDQEQLIAKLSSFFGVLALLLAAIGLYGVMSYMTVRRTVEIGIRMALGAPRLGVIGMVLRETFRLVAVGLAIGIFASTLAARLLSKALFGLSSFDSVTMLSAIIVIAIAAATAAYIPAWRASQIDPTIALRYE